jgi:hypothetical protein
MGLASAGQFRCDIHLSCSALSPKGLTLVERMTYRQSHLALCQRSAQCTKSNDVTTPRSSAVFAIGSQAKTER